ncbi:hypothetical protein FQN57_001346 [Myotisia sp. PD_48]|nr:hypothetical protein FQN57_001346 [Myotisia sp. PD_48]
MSQFPGHPPLHLPTLRESSGIQAFQPLLLEFLTPLTESCRLFDESLLPMHTLGIISAAAQLQQRILLDRQGQGLPEVVDFTTDTTLIALALHCFIQTWRIQPLMRRMSDDDLRGTILECCVANKLEHAGPAGRCGSVEKLYHQLEKPGGLEPGSHIDSPWSAAIRLLEEQACEIIFRADPKDWAAISYVLCLFNLCCHNIGSLNDPSIIAFIHSSAMTMRQHSEETYQKNRGRWDTYRPKPFSALLRAFLLDETQS